MTFSDFFNFSNFRRKIEAIEDLGKSFSDNFLAKKNFLLDYTQSKEGSKKNRLPVTVGHSRRKRKSLRCEEQMQDLL